MTILDTAVKISNDNEHEKHEECVPFATFREVFSFVDSVTTISYMLLGGISAIVAGVARPVSLMYFSSGLSDISAVDEEGLGPVVEVVYSMMVLGVVSFISETLEGTSRVRGHALRKNLPFLIVLTFFVFSRFL